MFGKKKYHGETTGHYTGEGVIDGIRFNRCGGVTNEIGGKQAEVYILMENTHATGGKRYPVYEYEVGGVVYRRAKEHVSYSYKMVEKMKGKPCKVLYDVGNPGNSKAK